MTGTDRDAAFRDQYPEPRNLESVSIELHRRLEDASREKAEEPSGVVATLQAAVEKTRETVIGQVDHVREQAVAAFHRIKGDGSRVENGGQENSSSAKGSGRRDIG
jgi:hypothetical protein